MTAYRTAYRCYLCGVECELVEIATLRDRQPRYVLGGWPAGDHEHRAHPPTPSELLAAGDAAMGRILETWGPQLEPPPVDKSWIEMERVGRSIWSAIRVRPFTCGVISGAAVWLLLGILGALGLL
jgi:hypothetical protein